MSKFATKEYLMALAFPTFKEGVRSKLCPTEDEWWDIHAGRTPRSLKPAQIVAKVEFVRVRCFPVEYHYWEDGNCFVYCPLLHDYRVHFRDDTYDCISITPVQSVPVVGKFYPRDTTHGNFVSWKEKEEPSASTTAADDVPEGFVKVGNQFLVEKSTLTGSPGKWSKGKSELQRRQEARRRLRFETEDAKPF